ncbi:hypothetical protein GCM10010336_51360 [Streptomyces goshikiensis]|nr:hypothetical protein GCM10010336_51360 [Streptomyces goshikiensis]
MVHGHPTLHHRAGPLHLFVAQRLESPEEIRRCVGEDPADEVAMVRPLPGAAAAEDVRGALPDRRQAGDTDLVQGEGVSAGLSVVGERGHGEDDQLRDGQQQIRQSLSYYMAFDVLQADGIELITLPYKERRRRLEVAATRWSSLGQRSLHCSQTVS